MNTRSEKAKLAGVEMGGPEFKKRETFRHHDVKVLSSNYALKEDMSRWGY